MFRALCLFLCFYSLVSSTAAQRQLMSADDELKGVIYRNEFSVDGRLHTNGFALAANFGSIRTYYKTNFYHVELGWLRDPRESSQNRNLISQQFDISSSFKFGKQNEVFVLRGGKGVKRYVSEKAKRKGVAIGYNYEAGPALAIVKPYYLDLIYQIVEDGRTDIEIRPERYSEENAEKFLTFGDIYGSSGFRKGVADLGIIPGIQGKLGLFFSLGASDEYIKSIETGLMADFFIRKVPIMVETEQVRNKPYFINLYVNLQFGKRSN